MNTWKPIFSHTEGDNDLKTCKEYLFYNENWKNEDTPNGIRVGFFNDDRYSTSMWNDQFDCYDSDDFSIPTHYLEIPEFL